MTDMVSDWLPDSSLRRICALERPDRASVAGPQELSHTGRGREHAIPGNKGRHASRPSDSGEPVLQRRHRVP